MLASHAEKSSRYIRENRVGFFVENSTMNGSKQIPLLHGEHFHNECSSYSCDDGILTGEERGVKTFTPFGIRDILGITTQKGENYRKTESEPLCSQIQREQKGKEECLFSILMQCVVKYRRVNSFDNLVNLDYISF